MIDLMKILELNTYVKSNSIRELLTRALPVRKGIGRFDVVNCRVWAKMLMEHIKKCGKTISTYEYNHKTTSNLIVGLDNESDDFIDKAIMHSKDIFLEYINDDGSGLQLFAILARLGDIDPGFTYNICFDSNQKVTGFVWMTSVMRSRLERFSSFICLDAMKRTTNVQMWPYIAPVVMNELKKT